MTGFKYISDHLVLAYSVDEPSKVHQSKSDNLEIGSLYTYNNNYAILIL